MNNTPPPIIKELTKKYEENKKYYTSPEYNEENTKIEFINPLFEALGWDIQNKQQHSPLYKEVTFEDKLQTTQGTKAPDYSFRIGGTVKYYLEAKKPNVKIEKTIQPSFQLRRYAWSKQLPISVLTNFETLAIYQIQTKPTQTQKPSTDRIRIYHYTEYQEKWEEIQNILGKNAILQGKFDNFIQSTTTPKGTTTVDQEFLKEIEQWRLLLARNIALRNKNLTIEELNYAVQLTIDRIIFLRIAEDRHIEKYTTLLKLTEKPNIYKQFTELCLRADKKYNSGLFHFNNNKNENYYTDNYTLQLQIDDNILKKIITQLYYPHSPYEFSVISPEILGKIYEQFLGKTIRLTPSHQARIEDKPEIKKAGGVYYTPQYIVDYIVENTLGEKIQGKTPNQISKIRVIDPACGSGSFLLRAYQYLLDYHLDYYTQLQKPPRNTIYTGKDGLPRLTIQEKKRILLNNIYGVDIDTLAVEVTKLSLLLKVLEDQNKDQLEQQQKLFHERALPNLSNNIKNGNSLIQRDILEQQELTLDDIKQIKPFEYKTEYKEVFEKDGFDVVVGNPPYVRTQILDKYTTEYCKTNYLTSSKGNFDIYVTFVEKALEILNKDGVMGYILPHKFFTAQYGKPLRKLVSEKQNLTKIIHFGDQQIFDNATTYTCLLFLNNKQNKKFYFDKIKDITKFKANHIEEEKSKFLENSMVSEDEWIFVSGDEKKVYDKLYNIPLKITEKTTISQGLATSADKIYISTLIEKDEHTSKLEPKHFQKEIILENNLLKPLLKGAEIKRYEQPSINNLLIFPYKTKNEKLTPLTRKEMKKYPKTFEYLNSTKNKLLERSNVDSNNWWLYPYPKNLLIMEKPKIIYQVLSQNGSFTLDEKGEYFYVGGGNAGGYAITTETNDINELKYLLGILNSNVTTFFISKVASCFKGGYYSFGKHSFEHFPLPSSELNNEPLINLVNEMLKLHKDLQNTKIPTERKLIQQQIELTDKKINEIVYELYNLTEEEINIIEENT